MTVKEIKSQLRELIDDRKALVGNDPEHDKIYIKDINALECAIDAVEFAEESEKRKEKKMKLKPCPFCGEYPESKSLCSGAEWIIKCTNPNCKFSVKTFPKETEQDAAALWNTRAEEPTIKTAHWDIACGSYTPFCSNCGEEPPAYEMTAFCPHCGAKMVTRGKGVTS